MRGRGVSGRDTAAGVISKPEDRGSASWLEVAKGSRTTDRAVMLSDDAALENRERRLSTEAGGSSVAVAVPIAVASVLERCSNASTMLLL